jgi:5-formyltetrahydrofolate cyclo-ligase
MKNEKRALRAHITGLFQALSSTERAEKSSRIADRLCTQPWYVSAKTIFAYLGDATELDTYGLLESTCHAGKRVALPRVECASKALRVLEVQNLAQDLEVGALGLLEPRAALPEISISALDLVLVPGRAFSEQGLRLGRGGGYYDRFLEKLEQQKARATTVALALEAQIFSDIPSAEHDRRVQWIVTEARVIKC